MLVLCVCAVAQDPRHHHQAQRSLGLDRYILCSVHATRAITPVRCHTSGPASPVRTVQPAQHANRTASVAHRRSRATAAQSHSAAYPASHRTPPSRFCRPSAQTLLTESVWARRHSPAATMVPKDHASTSQAGQDASSHDPLLFARCDQLEPPAPIAHSIQPQETDWHAIVRYPRHRTAASLHVSARIPSLL